MVAENNEDVMPFWYIPNWVAYTSLSFFIFTTLFCLCSGVFVFQYRNRPIVAMGQPIFIYQLIFGAILVSSTLLFKSIIVIGNLDETGLDICCNLMVWVAWIGLLLILTVLFCKTYRVYKVMVRTSIRKILTYSRQSLFLLPPPADDFPN
jgi:hypothetical protein